MRAKLCVIYNPAAGARRKRRLARVLAALGARGATVELAETNAPGDAETLARRAARDGYDALVAAGGDGTINEVMNGVGEAGMALGIIPLGTANVLACELELPRSAAALAECIVLGRPAPIFTGRANGRRFAMMAGIGFDARVVERVDLAWKWRIGKGAYFGSALLCLARQTQCRYAVEVDGVAAEAASLIVAKGHYYGGRFVVCPDARLGEASFEVALFGRGNRGDVLRYAAALGAGRLAALPDVRILRGQSVRVEGPRGELAQLDGDMGPTLPLEIAIDPRPLRILR